MLRVNYLYNIDQIQYQQLIKFTMSETPHSPASIATISELLALSNSQYRIYDLGRKIDKLSKEEFSKIELNQLPYPYPSQGHAFIAIAFWQKQNTQPFLWFVKLPLDERGLLNQGARDHFIAIIIDALGSDLTVDPTEKQEELLKSNPYNFTPAQYKLASLNSKIKRELKQVSSEYLPLFQQYIAGELGWDNWQNIAIQGISDFAVHLDKAQNTAALVAAFPHIVSEVLMPLCGALENETLPVTLIDAIIDAYHQTSTEQLQIQQSLLRSLASSCQHPHVIEFAKELLNNDKLSADLLIILAGRCWLLWQSPDMLMLYLERLIQSKDNELFTAIFKDLVAIPVIRPNIFQCMRDPNRSNELAQAIGLLFNRAS